MFKGLKITLPAILAAALAPGLASQSFAQSATYLSDDASRCEIFRSLSRVVPSDCATAEDQAGLGQEDGTPKFRGLVIRDGQSEQPTSVVQQDPPKELAIAMRVEFHFDSFELTPEAKQVLARVAEVLNDDLMREKSILIEGHADASGSAQYNLALSKNRARAVHAYLTDVHKVSPTRLAHDGKGEAALFDPQNPNSSVNRRAEFRNLSD